MRAAMKYIMLLKKWEKSQETNRPFFLFPSFDQSHFSYEKSSTDKRQYKNELK